MKLIKQLRSFWVLRVTTIVLACFSNAVAQTSYKVTDLGRKVKMRLVLCPSMIKAGRRS